MAEPAVDPRTEREGICRVTTTGGTGIEWVCIRPVHATAADQKDRGEFDSRGAPWKADRHYFVPRYPHRGQPSTYMPA